MEPTCSSTDNHQISPHHTKRTLSVLATGEAVCPPDTFTFNVTIASKKKTADEAQASVKRRSDYVQQVLRNHEIKEPLPLMDITSEQGEDLIQAVMNIVVTCGDSTKSSQVRNLLLEKLGSSVKCTMILCNTTSEWKAKKSKEAFTSAVNNAKAKACAISETLDCCVGPVVTLVELQQRELTGYENPQHQESQVESPALSSLTRSIKTATLQYHSRVSVVFEALSTKCTHRKCRKHN